MIDLIDLYRPENIIRSKDRDHAHMLSSATHRLEREERILAARTADSDPKELEEARLIVTWITDEIARREAQYIGAYDNFQMGEQVTIVADIPEWDVHVVAKPEIGMSGIVTELEIPLPTHVAIKFLSKELGYVGGRKFMTLYVKRWAAEPVNGRKPA